MLEGTNNNHLLGDADGRSLLETPSLVVDIDALKQNIAVAAKLAAKSKKAFWPHQKAHKCVQIAKLQQAAGAEGFCVASIGEAEVFARVGIAPLLITSTFCTERQIQRILALLAQGTSISVVVDNAALIDSLNKLCSQQNLKLDVLIDIDMGRHRAGCLNVSDAVALAKQLHGASHLNLTGIQAYAGQLSHMRKFSDRKQSAIEAEHRTGEFKMAVGGIANTEKFRCTGSCTGAIMLDIHNAELTELQWGTYLFMDEEYSSIEFGTQIKDNPFVPSLFVSSRVISANAKTHVTMDAGDKRFASKYGAPPRPVRGAPPGATFTPVSDEHGLLAAQPLPALGSLVELAVPHSDPTINLFDAIHVVSGDKLIDIWPIDARGVY